MMQTKEDDASSDALIIGVSFLFNTAAEEINKE